MPFETAVLPSRARADVRAPKSIPIDEQLAVDVQVPAPAPTRHPRQAPQAAQPSVLSPQPVMPAAPARVSGAPFALAAQIPPQSAWASTGQIGRPVASTAERLKTWVGLYLAQALPALFVGAALLSWAGSQSGAAHLAGMIAGSTLLFLGVAFAGTAVAAISLRERLPEAPRGPIRGMHKIGAAMLQSRAGRVAGLSG